MDTKIMEYIAKNRVCALAVNTLEGFPHVSAVHYSYINTPLTFYFSTENTSRKCSGLLNGEVQTASMVIGLSEEEWVTLQMDGEVEMITDKEEIKKVQDIHYAKHPNSAKFKDDPATVFLKFSPKWWRFTDYNTKPVTIITS